MDKDSCSDSGHVSVEGLGRERIERVCVCVCVCG